ncbi:MAG TPA: DEAD/DEAH box helicase [Natronincola sp.]|nr:DEAD/DEAH box helicase [Natronincola sp.]
MQQFFPLITNQINRRSQQEFFRKSTLPHCELEVLGKGFQRMIKEIRTKRIDIADWFILAQKADELQIKQHETKELISLQFLKERWQQAGVIPYPHQINSATRVIHKLQGQAILADEVGLGKTIEAGIILKEYILRGLVQKVLILTPASLLWQWYHELYEKFGIVAGIQRTKWDWESAQILIASLDTAKKEPHSSIIRKRNYDMLIIDEAHKLKNNNTLSFKFVNSLQKKYCLMLTATPIQNNLKELYNLIGLIKPGQLGGFSTFKSRFMKDKRTPKNPNELKELLSQVMIRNRREEGTVRFTKRIVHPVVVSLTPKEQDIYEQVTNFIKESSQRSGVTNILPLITLQREVCSSFLATALTLEKMMANMNEKDLSVAAKILQELAETKQNSKCDALEKLIKDLDDKVIIFTEYKASQKYIRYRLEKLGFSTLAFDGSLSRGKKNWIRCMFQKEGQILVSTESGGEGLNFQFCNQVINFDLPWNPMRLEQRIGRVHRLGQTRDVHIYNLVTKDTIEEHIMYLLHQKINMFESIIGELDTILLNLKLGKTFESEIMKIFLKHEQDVLREKLDQFGEEILEEQEKIKNANWNFF